MLALPPAGRLVWGCRVERKDRSLQSLCRTSGKHWSAEKHPWPTMCHFNEVTIINRFARWDTTESALGFVPLYVGNCVGLGPFLLPLQPPCGGGYGIALKKGNLPIPKTAFLIDQTVSSSTNTMETEISSMLRCRESVGPERLAFHSSRMCMKMVVKGCRWRTASGCRCRPRWWGTACQMLQTLRLKTVVPQARALLSGRYGVEPSIQDWLELQADKPSLKPG